MTKLIQEMNPDIITGYNINGFDFEYIKDRAKKFGILKEFRIRARSYRIEFRKIKFRIQ